MDSHSNICEEEISACCLDDRQRKVVIGDVKGRIGVYNYSNGALMKNVYHDNSSIVVGLHYYDEAKRFLAGYQNGEICLFDENDIEECHLLRSFEPFNRHPELLSFKFCPFTRTVLTAGASSNVARLWAYDSGKCEVELHLGTNSQGIVIAAAMMMPYPLAIVSDSLGNVIIWGSRGSRWQGLRISGFLNQSPPTAELEPSGRKNDNDEFIQPRILPTGGVNGPSVSVESPLETKTVSGVPHPPARQRGLRASIHPMSDMIRFDEILKKNSQFEASSLFRQSEAKWGKVGAAQAIAWDESSNTLYTGDDLGVIRAYDINDVINDIGKEVLLNETYGSKLKGICRSGRIDNRSALPPLYEDDHADEFDAAASVYLLGRAGNAMAYLGVKFMWGLTAHSDRVVSVTIIPGRGLISTAGDRLVKMWTFEGLPLGTLLQSVPVGTRNRNWTLVLDVDAIIDKENEELDEIIEKAREVAAASDKPDIRTMDFTGMQLGAQSADFSQSALRQRIDRSAVILGLDFPSSTHREKLARALSSDKSKDDSTVGDRSVDSSANTAGGKSLVDALKELKSTDAAVDYELKTKQMSYIQQKRKANKLESISKQYEEKTGIRIKTPGPKDPSVFDQIDEERSQADLDKLLTSNEADLMPAKDEHSVNNDLYSVSAPSETPSSPQSKSDHNRRGTIVRSKIASSIKEAHERGARTQSMVKSCRKYTAYDALDSAMKKVIKADNASPEELAQIRASREKKHRELMTMISLARNERIAPTSTKTLPSIEEVPSKINTPGGISRGDPQLGKIPEASLILEDGSTTNTSVGDHGTSVEHSAKTISVASAPSIEES